MNDEIKIFVFEEFPLDIINNVVAFNNIIFSSHFNVYAGKLSAGAVVMYHKVVGAKHSVIA